MFNNLYMKILEITDNNHLREAVEQYFKDPEFKHDYPIGTWITTKVTDMSYLFYNKTEFNEDIGGWDTSNVTNMRGMFYQAKFFNRNISQWDTSNVKDMQEMFFNAEAFNQNISQWNTRNVTNMSYMFSGAHAFNSPINTNGNCWNVSNVTDMSGMFSDATAFNQPINSWEFNDNVGIVFMFSDATRFLSNPDNYVYNMSKKIDSIINSISDPITRDHAISMRKEAIKTYQLYALEHALTNTNVGSEKNPVKPNPNNILTVMQDVFDFQNAGRRQTRKRIKRTKGKRNRGRKTKTYKRK